MITDARNVPIRTVSSSAGVVVNSRKGCCFFDNYKETYKLFLSDNFFFSVIKKIVCTGKNQILNRNKMKYVFF